MASLRKCLLLFLCHTHYYIQLPYIRWPSILVAIAHPHLAMTFSLVTTPCRRGFCAVVVPPCWPLVPYLPHPSLPPLLIRWILSRSSLVMTITLLYKGVQYPITSEAVDCTTNLTSNRRPGPYTYGQHREAECLPSARRAAQGRVPPSRIVPRAASPCPRVRA